MIDKKDAEKIWKLIQPIGVGMLSTEDQDIIRARPMQIVQSAFDGTLFFITRKSDHKVTEIENQDEKVCVAFSDPQRESYVSLSGRSKVVADDALVQKYWAPIVAPYFPEGPESDDLAILEIKCEIAEIWDKESSQMLSIFDLVRSNLKDTTPDPGEHEKIS